MANSGDVRVEALPTAPDIVVWAVPGARGDVPTAEIETFIAAEAAERLADLEEVESRVGVEHEHIHQDIEHVDGVADAVSGLLDQANVFAQDQVPPYLQQEVLNDTYAGRRTPFHDNFLGVPDGELPTVSDSGHTWKYLNGDRLEVRDGLLSSTQDAHAGYAEIDMGGPVRRMGCTFVIDDLGGTLTGGSGALALPTWWDGGVADNLLGRRSRAHIVTTDRYVELGIRDTVDGPIQIVGSRHYFNTPLAVGPEYRFEFVIHGPTLVAFCPDGKRAAWTDPSIAELGDDHACWEPFRSGNDLTKTMFRISSVWADAEPAANDAADDLAYRTVVQVATDVPEDAPRGPIVLDNAEYIRGKTSTGHEGVIIGIQASDTMLIRNPATDTLPVRVQQRFTPDGGWLLAAGSDTVANVDIGTQSFGVYGKLRLNTNNVMLLVTSPAGGTPEGQTYAERGSLLLYSANSAGGKPALWIKTTTAASNTGWELVGHASGPTANRPATPATGTQYFDTTLGRMTWWTGTKWVAPVVEDV